MKGEILEFFDARERFIRLAPIGTWIRRGPVSPEGESTEIGQTLPGKVYEDPDNPFVNVTNINQTGRSGIWFWADATPV